MAEEAVTEIATAEDLVAFAAAVNSGETTLNAVLTADIDLTGTPWYSTTDMTNNQIGTLENPYAGTFDGNGYTVSGMSIYAKNDTKVNDVEIYKSEYVTGFFGATDGATIENLTVSGTAEYIGQGEVVDGVTTGRHGGIVGKAVNTTLTNVVSEVEQGGYGYWYYAGANYGPQNIGGIVGWGQAVTLDMCANKGDILLYNTKYVAGIIGFVASAETPSSFNRCVNHGDILATDCYGGGFGFIEGTTGSEPDTITNSYVTGDVGGRNWNRSSNVYASQFSGGILMCGFTAGANVKVIDCFTVGQCYDDGTVYNTDGSLPVCASGIYMKGYNDGVTDQFDNAQYYVGNVNISYSNPSLEPGIGRSAIWEYMSSAAFLELMGDAYFLPEGAEYPMLKWECAHEDMDVIGNGDGTHTVSGVCLTCGFDTGISYDEACADNDADFLCDACEAYVASDSWYEIADADDLLAFSKVVSLGGTGVNAKLTDDVDLTGIDWFNTTGMINNQIGSLDAPYTGTFDGQGYAITGMNIYSKNDVTVGDTVLHKTQFATGLFAATNGATIKDLTVGGNICLIGQGEEVDGVSTGHHGAIVGKAVNTTLIGCTAEATYDGSYGYWYYDGAANYGPHNIGGLVGTGAAVTMDMCVNNSDILIYNTQFVAGLIGYVQSAEAPSTFIRCVNNGDIMASANYGGLVGYIEGTTGETPDTIESCYNTGKVAGRTWNRSAGIYANCFSGGSLMNGFAANANVKVKNSFTVGTTYDDGKVYKDDGTLNPSISGIYHAGYNDSNTNQFDNANFYYDGIVNYTYSVETGINRQGNWATFSNPTWVATLGEDFFLPEGAEYPMLKWECEHDFSETTYASTGYRTHAVAEKCAICGMTSAFGDSVDCTDEDGNGLCDGCGASMTCSHEEVGEVTYTSNGDGTHTATATCDFCGGSVLFVDEAEKEVITLDFKAFAKDMADEAFWTDLKTYDETITTNRYLGKLDNNNPPTVENMQAYAQIRDALDAGYDWNIDEEISRFDSDLKRLHINSSDDVPWGLLWYSYYTGSKPELSKLGFTVYADEAGWYDLTLDSYKVNYIYGRPRGEEPISGLQAATGDPADAAGGGNVDIYVNDVLAKHDFSFNGGLISASESMGAVYLNEGANTVVLEAIYAYNGPTVTYGGRFTCGLKALTFTEIDAPALTPDTAAVIDLAPYLAVGETVDAACTVESSDSNVATGAIDENGKLAITALEEGTAVLTVSSAAVEATEETEAVEAVELAHVGVTVTEESVLACVDADADDVCDDCGAEMPCAHENVTRTIENTAKDEHTFTYTCECGEVVETRVMACYDYDDDLVCDLCGGEVTCVHEDTTKGYTPVGDGTHNKTHVCNICGENVEDPVAEPCVDDDADAVCDLCGGSLECKHENLSNSYVGNGDGTHEKTVTCADCGEVIEEAVVEDCTDEDEDGYCDGCEDAMPEDTCDHAETTSETVYNGDKTHTTTVTCVCGEVVSTETADCVDEDKDCACDTCEGVIKTVTKTTVAGSNMNLGNELQVNFIVNNPAEGDYVAYIHQDTDDEGGLTIEIPEAEWEAFGTTRQKIAVRVRAMEMTDALTLTIVDADGYDIIDAYTTSVREYAAKALVAASSTDEMKTLVVDMVNYGAAAQTNFSYKAEDLANNQLTDAQKALATGDITCANNQIKGTNNLGANLALDDCILLNVFFSGFKTRDVSKTYAKVTFTNWKDEAKEVIIPGSEFSMYGTVDRYKVTIDDIVLADAYCLVSVEVYDEGAETPFAYGSDSVESYANRGSATAAAPLYNAIMKFATSAKAYLLSRQ
ncbi:MAG: hypothetical protein J6J43_06790 [Oscillospiraceae bacterium]|nr:hypothetical protein [Oscillospiraceae bacterium]